MDICYVTLRYINTIHYCTKLLIFFLRRNVYSSQWEAKAEWFQRTQDDDDDWKVGQQGLPKFRFLRHTYCWLHRNAVPKNILFAIWNLAEKTHNSCSVFNQPGSINRYQRFARRYWNKENPAAWTNVLMLAAFRIHFKKSSQLKHFQSFQ